MKMERIVHVRKVSMGVVKMESLKKIIVKVLIVDANTLNLAAVMME